MFDPGQATVGWRLRRIFGDMIVFAGNATTQLHRQCSSAQSGSVRDRRFQEPRDLIENPLWLLAMGNVAASLNDYELG